MKRFCIVLLLLGLIVVPQQLALESFKRQSTFILDDDLENILSPWTIYDVNGWRLFTNLSNLTGSNEELMNNSSNNAFMIGALLPEIIPSLRTGIFWSTRKYTIPNDITLAPFGLDPISGSGSVFGIWNQFIDVDNDGNYDIHDFVREHRSDFYDELLTSTYLVVAYDLGASIVGFNYSRYKTLFKETYFDTIDLEVYDLYPDFVESLNSIAGYREDYIGLYENPSNYYVLSFILKDLAGYRASVSVGADFYKQIEKEEEIMNYFEDLAPRYQDYRNDYLDNMNSYYEWVNPVNQFIVSIGALKKEEGNLNQFGLSFFYGMGGDYERERYDGREERYLTGVMGYTESYIFNEYEVDSLDFNFNEMGIGFFGRFIRKLGDNVEFGMGLFASTSQNSYNYDGVYNTAYDEVYNDGDNEALDADDYTETGLYEVTYNVEETHAWTTFSVPVGVEITITPKKNWFIRFGANPYKSLHSSTEKFEIVDYTNEIVTNVNGAGDTTITIIPPSLPPEYKTSEYIENSGCSFSYGLGWHPNNNISIDFITMFAPTGTILDLGWIRSLRLSTTLKFY